MSAELGLDLDYVGDNKALDKLEIKESKMRDGRREGERKWGEEKGNYERKRRTYKKHSMNSKHACTCMCVYVCVWCACEWCLQLTYTRTVNSPSVFHSEVKLSWGIKSASGPPFYHHPTLSETYGRWTIKIGDPLFQPALLHARLEIPVSTTLANTIRHRYQSRFHS